MYLRLADLLICQSKSGTEDLFKIGWRRLRKFFRTVKGKKHYSNFHKVRRFSKELKPIFGNKETIIE